MQEILLLSHLLFSDHLAITTKKIVSSQWTPVQGFRFADGELRRAVSSLRKTTKFVNQNWDSIQTQIGQTRGKDPVKTKNN